MNQQEQQQYSIDQQWIRRSFDRAASLYDSAAVLQREVVDRLDERLDLIRIQPQTILDLGCGTGYGMRVLRQRYKKARLLGVDLSTAMLAQARNQASRLDRWRGMQRFLEGDAARLPLADDSVDMLFSSLTLQWCNDLDQVFSECRRVLKPGGLLMFATLGPDTLKELRAAWRAVDGGHPHVSAFMDMHDIGDAMVRSRLADPVMDVEDIVLTYDSVGDLMKDLKLIGSRNATHGRHHGLTGKQRMRAMQAAYEEFRRDGCLPATYEVAYGHAWVSEKKQLEYAPPAADFPIPVRQLR